jgi:DNA polymerase elongation subunit (family B)
MPAAAAPACEGQGETMGLTFAELDYGQKGILADHWLETTPERRAQIAASLQSTVDTIERHLQLWRKHENERLDYERRALLAQFGGEPVEQGRALEAVLTAPESTPAPLPAPVLAAPRVTLNGAIFDIETTDFGTESYAGYMIACCILPLDSDEVQTYTIRFEEHGDDLRLLRDVLAALGKFDVICGHNASSFDLGWLHSRWMYHRARGADVGPWPKRWLVFDTFQAAKLSAIKTRKSLGNLGDYLGLEGEKTTIFRSSWNKVRSPYQNEFETTIANVQYHCAQDVILNRNLFDILWAEVLSMGKSPLKPSKWGYTPALAAMPEAA